ncbi:MAG TPA: thioredoxin domain-containing protein [Gemmatimonadaceae bacterium]|nr:thioredoxin domain-containing protein [Gemmatimonadaceae bacterium]
MAAKPPSGRSKDRRPNVVRNASTRPKGFYAILLLIAVAGASILAYTMTRKPSTAAAPAPLSASSATAGPPQGYLLGKADAPVKILEFADFECPACGRFATITEPDIRTRLIDTGLASFTYYDYPLPQHLNSQSASNAAACADEQGKFWPMHDRLYGAQDQWNSQATDNPKPMFMSYASGIGLNMSQFESCYDTRKHQSRIVANFAEGERRRVNSTPTFIVGDKQVANALSYDELKAMVDEAAKK